MVAIAFAHQRQALSHPVPPRRAAQLALLRNVAHRHHHFRAPGSEPAVPARGGGFTGDPGARARAPTCLAIHLTSFYRERFGHAPAEFPVCEQVAAQSLALPFFPAMTEAQVARVADALAATLT